MPWNGAGVFVRETPVASGPVTWANTKAAGDIQITTADHDFHDQDIATGMQNTVTRDGQNAALANLPMGGFKHTGVADGVAATDYATFGQLTTFQANLQGYIFGLTISNNVATPNTKIDVAAGVARDSTNVTTMSFTGAAKTVDFTASGAGGLDTGSIAASTWYAILLINGASGTSVMATKETAGVAISPTMPSGYTIYRYVGSVMTDGSVHLRTFTQYGQRFLWNIAITDLNTNSPPTTNTAITLTIPLSVVTFPLAGVNYIPHTAGGDFVAFQPASGTPSLVYEIFGPVVNVGTGGQIADIPSNTSGQIGYAATRNTDHVGIFTNGWIDPHVSAVF